MNLFRYQYAGWYDSYSETISFLTEDIWTPWPTCIYSQMHQNARGTHAHTHFISFYLCFQFQFIFCFIFSLYPCTRHQTAILASSVDHKVMHQSFEAPHPLPPRETQAGDYEATVPTFLPPFLEWESGSYDWRRSMPSCTLLIELMHRKSVFTHTAHQ